jgi:hypothetical protein
MGRCEETYHAGVPVAAKKQEQKLFNTKATKLTKNTKGFFFLSLVPFVNLVFFVLKGF